MSKTAISKTLTMPNGETITIETGKLATQADGSVVVRQGNCMLLATVVSTPEAKEGQGFFPLSVDYQEKFSSAGRIPGGFFRREGKISDHEVLVCRLVDRALRPLFPEDYLNEVQVMISMISSDKEVMPDSLAALAASAAITLSDIPFAGPISEVRVIKLDGKYIVNPKKSEAANATLDLIIGATTTSVTMVEGEGKEVQEAEMVEAIRIGHDAIKLQCAMQLELSELCGGKKPSRTWAKEEVNEELKAKVKELYAARIKEVANKGWTKAKRKEGFDAIKADMKLMTAEMEEIDQKRAKKYFADLEYDIIRDLILDEGIRLDGRKTDEIRAIWTEIDYLPSAHGSAIFTRGETQSLTTVTLGSKIDELMLDKAMELQYSNFILHYNFPGFSTGEVRPNRGPGRREVGHGNLAQRSLKQVLPGTDLNPYTIRIVSDILESNGSSSMATVCAGSLALMDAGIKIKSHVSGIAMGLITRADGKSAVLSDILGDEDHLGDMDFKVTGTANGICGCQMDIKIEGLSFELLTKALDQAKAGRLHILNILNETIPAPRADYKPHAPRMVKMIVENEFIGAIIGPGGKIIKEMQAESGATISIEEVDGKGEVFISSPDQASIDKVVAKIKGITTLPEIGKVYDAKVKSIKEFGAFVEFLPGKEGLLHISEIEHRRLDTMDGVLNIGDMVQVKLLDVDKKTGKYKFSRKVLLPRN